jgi:DNA-binding NtrC family response regulator
MDDDKGRPSILLVEDDEMTARTVSRVLGLGDRTVTHARTYNSALESLQTQRFDAVICDLGLPDGSGLDLLTYARSPDAAPFLVFSGTADVQTAVEAMRRGAFDYVTKLSTPEVLLAVVDRAVQAGRDRCSLARSHQRVPEELPPPSSPRMRRALELAQRTAQSRAQTALVIAETGAGADEIAAFVHRRSPRAHGPFVHVALDEVAPEEIDAVLFGAAGAPDLARAHGALRAAHGGTLVLESIESLPEAVQAKLVRALETKRFHSADDALERTVECFVIGTATPDTHADMRAGRLRPDLYYRLASMVIQVPPLRERPEDIPALARHLVGRLGAERGLEPLTLSPGLVDALTHAHWAGNLRELRSVLDRMIVGANGSVLTEADFRRVLDSSALRPRTLAAVLLDAEREHVARVLRMVEWDRPRAARYLGVDESALEEKIRTHELSPDSPRAAG